MEHEILKISTEANANGFGRAFPRGIPHTLSFERKYDNSYGIYYGTLVDILNKPEEYKNEATPKNKVSKKEEISTDLYSYKEVSDAIEVLIFHGI